MADLLYTQFKKRYFLFRLAFDPRALRTTKNSVEFFKRVSKEMHFDSSVDDCEYGWGTSTYESLSYFS